jgi:D-aminopeptidase
MTTSPRLRDLDIRIGDYPTGAKNAITDVPGVLVGMTTLISDSPSVARTGVTAIFPRPDIHIDSVFAGFHSFNGIGEMTGLPFLEETGMLSSPVLLTGTHQLGLAYDSLVRYGTQKYGGFTFTLPVVGETYDGWLNSVDKFPLREEHFISALESASDGPIAEGNTGGGTGMIAYEFKAGTGTASRQVTLLDRSYTVGVLVQANHGDRRHLLVDGVKVGRAIPEYIVPFPWASAPASSSILIIIATDAPLLSGGCKRLAQRAIVGLARTGGYGLDGSGDLFLAFSTGNHLLRSGEPGLLKLEAVPFFSMDDLIIATVEAVEEAILNALIAAQTMVGIAGHTAQALPHELLLKAMKHKE